MSQQMPHPAYPLVRLTETTAALLPELEALYREFAEHEGITSPVSQFMDAIGVHLEDDAMLLLLAQRHDGPTPNAIGYVLAFDVPTHPFIPTWQRSGYITQLFVAAAYQRQGIGQALATACLAWFTERGLTQVMLNVDVANEPAARFWQQQGFTPHLLRMKRGLPE
jgi:ribosomal protein S18 acetylase RimI-like enzyme